MEGEHRLGTPEATCCSLHLSTPEATCCSLHLSTPEATCCSLKLSTPEATCCSLHLSTPEATCCSLHLSTPEATCCSLKLSTPEATCCSLHLSTPEATCCSLHLSTPEATCCSLKLSTPEATCCSLHLSTPEVTCCSLHLSTPEATCCSLNFSTPEATCHLLNFSKQTRWMSAFNHIGAQWNVWMPRDISAMTNSCVVIPCTFMYPASIRPYRGIHGIWYFGQPYPQLFPPVVYKSRTEIVHESYKGRTRLLGDLLQKNCTLQISNIGAEHSGRYYFRADLGGANIYTYPDFTELKVLDQPNIDVPEEIVTDESLDLTCYAPDNCPEMSPEIHWMYTDYLPDPLFTTDFVEEGNTAVMSSTLTFTPRPMHNGQLLGCRVHYPNTTFFYERLISLDVKYAPRKVWVNVSQEVMEGNSVVLHCDVDSNPPPRISWHFKDEELMSDIASNASLYLESLTPEQEGVYTCVGDNGYGVMNTSLYLAVRYPPREPWVNGSLTVLEGTSLALHCGTQGNPAPTLTWLKDGELVGTITADEVSVLELLEIRPQADGTYRCLAENEHGRASTSLNITVECELGRFLYLNIIVECELGRFLYLNITVECELGRFLYLNITMECELGRFLYLNITVECELGRLLYLNITVECELGRLLYLNITVQFAPILLDDSKCTIVREGVQCVCIASGNPEPSIEFYLPDLNITINETNGRFNYYTHSDGYTSTGMIKLRDKGERGNNGGTAVHVHCSITNMYGTETIRLELQQEKKYMMAVIVGTIGGVAVIAFIIAAVRYVGQNNKKENSNPGQDVGSKVENPSMFYSAVKKDKQSLRKKVLKTELLGSKFNSILEESTGDDSDYQPVGSMAGLERQELNYAALEFMRGRPREGGLGRGDDGSDYTEIKAK
ncbi:hypothetical protein P4O66_018137 [Electrophorus voltai]|uniref:Ig-like domain-containing protein n=1 Tax=Electrophorus voltai TaxID=2609070 RepID=A0AAD8YSH9_9TELE|nr:hypothetical protein P4O66_018137 [Electrophorus voltai]